MKLAPRNQTPGWNTSIDQLSNSMAKLFVKQQHTDLNSQARALRMPNEKEIQQAHLNIKLGNKQQSEALQKQHGSECHYCKSQELLYVGRWVSTCPIIRDILKLEKAPLPMAVFEPAIRAVTGDRAASMVDTGSQVHVSCVHDFFLSLQPLDQVLPLNLASPSFQIYATHRGRIRLPYNNLEIDDVLYCKEVQGTLLSLSQFFSNRCTAKFWGNDIVILNQGGEELCIATFTNHRWFLLPEFSSFVIPTVKALKSNAAYQWHCRLGHASDKVVRNFLKLYVPDFNKKSWMPFFCENCLVCKSTRRQMKGADESSCNRPRDLMVSDVMGPLPVPDIHLNKYLLTLCNHVSTFVFCFPIKTRDQVPKALTDAFRLIKSFFNNSVKFLRSNNAKEYTGQNFKISLTALGTQQLFTSPYTPEQNGEAERLSRTLGDSAQTKLWASGLPTTFWSYAYKCAAYIHNRIPNKTKERTPMEMWCGRKPQPFRIYPFGTRAIVHIPTEKQGKLDDRGRICKLIGFQDDSRGYFFWDDVNKQIINSNYVKFLDFKFEHKMQEKMKIQNLINKVGLCLGQENTDQICKSQDNMIENIATKHYLSIPSNLKDAKKDEHWYLWLTAINKELKSFDEMNVWTPVDKRLGMKIIKTRFVFDIKQRNSPSNNIYKARLVARGFCQRYGIDCKHTYAPTASLSLLRLLFAMATKFKWSISFFDISVAYLHSKLEEEIYVDAPDEFRPEWNGKVMKLNKAMYGLKQAGRCWWLRFKSIMNKLGFEAEELDQSIYRCTRDNVIVYVWMHVDNGVIFLNDTKAVSELKENLMTFLKVKLEDTISRIVGIDLVQTPECLTLLQSKFAEQIVEQFEQKSRTKLLQSLTVLPELKLQTSTNEPLEQKWYQSIIGSLNYLALGTRPNLSFAVGYLARYAGSPQQEHWDALRHLLGYVKHTVGQQLQYLSNSTCKTLDLWSDGDWGGEFQHSTLGFVLNFFNCTIAWGSRRQKLVASSTCAAELMAMGMAVEILTFVIQLVRTCLKDVKINIHCDNKAAVLILEGSKMRIKSLEHNFYIVNDLIRKYGITLKWTTAISQLANICTK
ncbi:hypothetical protein O181_078725 [Austropuccinia psidii MF-1]|uniref:Integrase catalytic domain-containing protein n=1 Tax=Austropuccinia psidii MF-1 TaxID=1389203 RepID=A0A9Q3FDD6_9BASI|nr:hypothetical protein [Austropuccinia psidii MF-1]